MGVFCFAPTLLDSPEMTVCGRFTTQRKKRYLITPFCESEGIYLVRISNGPKPPTQPLDRAS